MKHPPPDFGFAAFIWGLRLGWAEFTYFWSLRTWVFAWLFTAVCNAAVWTLLGRLVGDERVTHFLLLGNSAAAGAQATLWAISATTWSRMDGTFPLLLVAPRGLVRVTLGRTVVWALNGVATSVSTFTVLTVAFGLHVLPGAWVGLVVMFAIINFSLFGMAVFMGAWVTRAPQFRNWVLVLYSGFLVVFCGVSVPVTFWPEPLRQAASLSPLTHGLRAIRGIADADPRVNIGSEVLLEVVIGLAWLTLGASALRWLSEQSRRSGSNEG